MDRSQEAAQILIRVLEALARASGKTLGQKTRADILRACELLAMPDDLDLLEDLLEQPTMPRVTQSFDRQDYGDERFAQWRAGR